MAVNYTTIGPIDTTLHVEGEQVQAQIVAFGWDDANPTQVTGYWLFGPEVNNGMAFIPVDAITDIHR